VSQIETIFGDYRFDSRLAARWAIFFDVLGLPFRYRSERHTFTELGSGHWTPDFCLPEFGSERSDCRNLYLSVMERQPTERDVETAAHLFQSDRTADVVLFSNGVGAPGICCWKVPTLRTPRSYSVEFAQCPFCGSIYLACCRDEGSDLAWFPSHGCVEKADFAEVFNIDEGFLDSTGKGEQPPLPTDSPMLWIARRAAAMLQFGSAWSLDMVRGMRESVAVLRQNGVFARPEVTAWLILRASRLAADENYPRFMMRAPIMHAKHLRFGNGPCPCDECQPDKLKAALNLAELSVPERTM
jgi:hypothetical protein